MSGYGLRVRDPATGEILVDYESSLPLILGTVSSSSAAGSVTDARFANGTPFGIVQSMDFAGSGKEFSYNPGTHTLSWTASTFSAVITYGIRS